MSTVFERSAWIGTVVAFATALGVACGSGGSKKVDAAAGVVQPAAGTTPPPGSAPANPASGCTDANCAKTTMDINAKGFGGPGLLIGIVGKDVGWVISGTSLDSKDRKVGVLLNKIPKGSKMSWDPKSNQVGKEISVTWTPDKKIVSSEPLEVYLRDMDFCAHKMRKAKKDEKGCHAPENMAEFDTKLELKWEISTEEDLQNLVNGNTGGGTGGGTGGTATGGGTDGNVVNVTDNSLCKPGTTQEQILGGVVGKLPGLLSGGLNPSLITSLLGGGGLGGTGGSTPTPQECIKP